MDIRDLSAITADRGYLVTASTVATADGVGFAAQGLGDVNGDGVADYALGVAPDTIAVIFGGATPPGSLVGNKQILDYTALPPSRGFIVKGAAVVGAAGDINGDGRQEIALGDPVGIPNNQGNGYILFGKAGSYGTVVNGQATITLSQLAPADGFLLRGKEGGDNSGSGIAVAGDVNGDGFGDVLVGGQYADPAGGQMNAGNAYIVFGHAGTSFGVPEGGRSVLFLGGLNPGQGVLIAGGNIGATAGSSVSPLGDFNGDGIDDLVIGAPGDNTLYASGGAAYVVFGTRGSFGPTVAGQTTLYAGTMGAAQGFAAVGDYFSSIGRVRGAGDVNGDGLPDLLLSGSGLDSYGASAYVIFGTRGAIGQTLNGRQVVNLVTLSPAAGFAVKGAAQALAISRLGDFNRDGIDDFALGDSHRDAVAPESGVGYVIYGTRQRFGVTEQQRDVLDLTTLPRTSGIIFRGERLNDWAGRAVAGIGDVNGDGRPDFLVGAPTKLTSNAGPGTAYIIYG